MFDGLIIWLGYVISGAFGLTLGCGLLLAVGRRWGPPKLRAHLKSAPYGCALPVLFVLVILIGVGWALRPVEQPAKIRMVRAIEVPINSDVDREDLKNIMKRHGKNNGLHFVDTSESWKNAPPAARKTLYFALDRPSNNLEEWEVIANDDGPGTAPWVNFFHGIDPAKAKDSRDLLVSALKGRFTEALEVPIMPTGALPLREDLVRTQAGYQVRPERTSAYSVNPAQRARPPSP